MSKLKIGKGRSDYDMDSESTLLIRVYLFKDKTFPNEILNTKTQKITTEGANQLLKNIRIINDCNIDYFTGKGLKGRFFNLKRLQIFANREDKFYSILYGYKVSPTKITISELRYLISEVCFENDLFCIYVSNYDTHSSLSTWDTSHIADGPAFDLKGGDAEEFIAIEEGGNDNE